MACPDGRCRFGVVGAREWSRGSVSRRAGNSCLPIHLGHARDYGDGGGAGSRLMSGSHRSPVGTYPFSMHSAGRTIRVSRQGCKTRRSSSLETMISAPAATASSRYLLSLSSRQSVILRVGSTQTAASVISAITMFLSSSLIARQTWDGPTRCVFLLPPATREQSHPLDGPAAACHHPNRPNLGERRAIRVPLPILVYKSTSAARRKPACTTAPTPRSASTAMSRRAV
jgi:hypothetical protein